MKKHYELIDNSHPRFNLWRVVLSNGMYYPETYPKNVDPNELEMMRKQNDKIRITIDIDLDDEDTIISITRMPYTDKEIIGNGCHIGRDEVLGKCYHCIKARKY